MTDQDIEYRGFTISWQEPPLTSEKWTANVASESVSLARLTLRTGAEIIDGRTRSEMLSSAHRYIDGLYASTRPNVLGTPTTTVRDIYLEALAKKNHDVPWPEIREHLINRGHDIGSAQIGELNDGRSYELTFETGEKITFDGADYHLVRR